MKGRRKDQTEEECSGWVQRVGDDNEKKIPCDTEGINNIMKESQDTFRVERSD